MKYDQQILKEQAHQTNLLTKLEWAQAWENKANASQEKTHSELSREEQTRASNTAKRASPMTNLR